YRSAEEDEQCDRDQAPSQPGSAGARFPLGRGRHPRICAYAIDAHRLGDILDGLQADVFVAHRELGLDLLVDAAGDTNPSPFGQVLQPGGDVDPVPVELFPVDDDIPQVDADAKLHTAVDRKFAVASVKLPLDGHRTLHGIDHAGELGQHVIPWRA